MTDSPPDYATLDPPDPAPGTDGFDPDAVSYTERRAWLLQYVNEKGCPQAINQNVVADLFDVNQSTISRDLDRIAESEAELGNPARVRWSVSTVLEQTMAAAAVEGDHHAAIKAATEYADWMDKTGVLTLAPEQQQVALDQRVTVAEDGPFEDADGDPTWISPTNQQHFDTLIGDAADDEGDADHHTATGGSNSNPNPNSNPGAAIQAVVDRASERERDRGNER